MHVNKHIVVESKTHKRAQQFKVDVWLEGRPVKPVKLDIFVKFEHTKCWVEKFAHNQTEVFFTHPADIDSRLLFKLNL